MTANQTTTQDPSANGEWPRHVLLCRDKLMGAGAGAERVFIEQATTLVKLGIRCSIVLFAVSDSLREQLPDEAEIVVLGERKYDDLVFFPKLLRLSRVLRKLRPDCVIAHQSSADYLRWALMGTGIPYFLIKYTSPFYLADDTTKYSLLYRNCFSRVRNSMPAYVEGVRARWRAGPPRRLVNEYYALRDWLGTRGARHVFTLTSQSKWELRQLYGIQALVWTPGSAQADHVPPRDDATIRSLRHKYGIRDGVPVILSVNRLEYRKRLNLLVEAFRLLSARGVEAKLILVGEGEQRGLLERQVRDAGLDGTVQFAGRVNEESLHDHYHMCDVAVAVIWGSWALSVVEPLVYDKKLVITDEIPDLLRGVPNLFRVRPEPIAVARGLEQALSHATEESYIRVKGELSWDRQADILLSHMRSSAKPGMDQQV